MTTRSQLMDSCAPVLPQPPPSRLALCMAKPQPPHSSFLLPPGPGMSKDNYSKPCDPRAAKDHRGKEDGSEAVTRRAGTPSGPGPGHDSSIPSTPRGSQLSLPQPPSPRGRPTLNGLAFRTLSQGPSIGQWMRLDESPGWGTDWREGAEKGHFNRGGFGLGLHSALAPARKVFKQQEACVSLKEVFED